MTKADFNKLVGKFGIEHIHQTKSTPKAVKKFFKK